MRIREIDISKGILILIVVLLHSYIPYSLVVYLSYLLAAFMFISGYLFKDENFFIKLKKIFLNLLFPFYFLSTIGYIIYFYINKITHYSSAVFTTFFEFIIFGYAPMDMPVNVLPLWYLYMFAVAEIVFMILIKLNLVHFTPFLSVFTTFFLHNQTRFFKLEVAFHGLIWFYFGYWFRKKGYKYKLKRPFIMLLLSIMIVVIIAKINGFNDWRDSNYGKYPLLSYIGELAFIILIISLSNLIKIEKLKKFMELFGRYTIFVLGYHLVLSGLIALVLKDPLSFVEKYWYIYYGYSVTILYLFLKFVPKKVIYFLSGQFYLLRKT
ncbi:acyltransferase family protein [Thermosipho atlanticus]|uniref:Fucose 4-O-acetylase n=1 Tax=Thermosipho atlanticus DSM 15807 TaxID=1123380 RepID=A0A1M5S452_9BACT|nr:acyltransferase family protein [Thermosipho atlanticus]SHH33367.1 Fucose 4-O-acetylase [Thermosipho atlanticus DSM 15807]